jgi:hypothetical protein
MNITAPVMIAVGSCGAAICLDGLLKRIACSDDALQRWHPLMGEREHKAIISHGRQSEWRER